MDIKKISIKNFRVFKEKTTFELRPFTILTGPNNSGKSSFTKFLMLITNGVSSLDFNTDFLNLLDYKSSLNWNSASDQLEFELANELGGRLVYKYCNKGLLKSIDSFEDDAFLFSFSREEIEKKAKNDMNTTKINFTQKINYNLFLQIFFENEYYNDILLSAGLKKQSIVWEICENGLLFEIFKNGNNETLNFSEDLKKIQEDIFQLFTVSLNFLNFDFNNLVNITKKSFINEFCELAKNELFKNSSKIKEHNSYEIKVSPLFNIFLTGIYSPNQTSEFKDNFVKDIATNFFEKGLIYGTIFSSLDLTFLKQKVNFLSTNRGNQKRVMMNSSKQEFNSIIIEFSKIKIINKKFIETCFEILGIEGELEVNTYENTITTFYLVQNEQKLALADLGFGYTQLVPIILKVHNLLDEINKVKSNSVYEELDFPFNTQLVLEEPESNLHPNLQSKLAELLVYIKTTFDINFVIETHSEYFIRKLQYLTAKKQLKTDDVVLYYFNDDKYVTQQEPKVKEIFINKDGSLSDAFGPGFFDEATKLQFDLIRLQKQQMN